MMVFRFAAVTPPGDSALAAIDALEPRRRIGLGAMRGGTSWGVDRFFPSTPTPCVAASSLTRKGARKWTSSDRFGANAAPRTSLMAMPG